MSGEIDLVPDTQQRNLIGQSRNDLLIGACRATARIQNMQDHIGLFDCAPGARDANPLDFTIGIGFIAYAGGVDDVDWYAFDMNRFGDLVPCGASDRRDDGHIITGECIEQ